MKCPHDPDHTWSLATGRHEWCPDCGALRTPTGWHLPERTPRSEAARRPSAIDAALDRMKDHYEPRSADAPFVVGDVVTIPGTVVDIFGDGTVRVRFAALGSNRFSMLLDASALRRESAPDKVTEPPATTDKFTPPRNVVPVSDAPNASQATDPCGLLQRLVEFIRRDQCDEPCWCCYDYLRTADHLALLAGLPANPKPAVEPPAAADSSCPDDCANHSDGAGGIIVSEGCPVHDRGGSGGS